MQVQVLVLRHDANNTNPAAATNNTFPLVDELVGIEVYEWNDEFVDLSDPNVTFDALNPILISSYTYSEDLQSENVYSEFETPIFLENDVRYLFCTQTFNENMFFGFNTKLEYLQNQDAYPLTFFLHLVVLNRFHVLGVY